MNDTPKISAHFQALNECLNQVDQDSIAKIVAFLRSIRAKGGCAWIVGNGGSAALAGHFANDLRKMCALPAIGVADLTAIVTAYGNDGGWDTMFSYPLHLMLKPIDCLVAISTSGRSRNVVEAATQVGKDRLIILTGIPGGVNRLATLQNSGIVYAQSPDITVQEDVHLIVCHAVAKALTDQPS